MANKKGQTIRSGAREVIARIIDVCDREAERKCLDIPIEHRTERAAFYTGVSESSIKKIRKEYRNRPNLTSVLKSPGKKRPRLSYKHKIDDSDFDVIRRTIEDFYLNLKKVPTCKTLLAAIKDKIDFTYGYKTLNRILRSRGFIWRKCQNKRKVLIERPSIVHWRVKYLSTIRQYRQEGRNIVYLDETWVDNDMTVNKCWQNESVTGVVHGIRSSSRLIVVHAGSESGFVPGAALVFRSGLATGDYHGQMNRDNFEKWLLEKLLPNIPPESVVVLDNAPYHSHIEDKVPTKYSTRPQMISWLIMNNLKFDPSWRKFQLYEIIAANKPTEKKYKIDALLRSVGHTPLRLPPYMCDLNPIELAWAGVKRYIREHNTSELSIKDLNKLTLEAINSISAENWQAYVKHVRGIEEKYWEVDGQIETIIDDFVIRVGSSSSDDETSSFSDEDSDLEGIEPLESQPSTSKSS